MESGSRVVWGGWTGGGGVNSILQFRLEKGDDATKHCQKMKRRQRTHLDSMRKNRDTVRWSGDVGQMRDDIREGKRRSQHQLG
jgi:hypothetical protein